VGNGAEALAWLARAGRPELIVLDFVMPVMNGAELLAQVRADPALGRVPTLLMTAAIVSSATPLPAADATLVKPFDLDELLGAVGRLVHRS
jgi:two-component system response regulator